MNTAIIITIIICATLVVLSALSVYSGKKQARQEAEALKRIQTLLRGNVGRDPDGRGQ